MNLSGFQRGLIFIYENYNYIMPNHSPPLAEAEICDNVQQGT